MIMTTYKNCQSCGMPMKKDPEGGGTNADGSRNSRYCSYCFRMGEFIQADMTVGEMKVLVKGKLVEMGFPKFMAGFFTRGIPKLERWSQ
jgi:hypothetical protein